MFQEWIFGFKICLGVEKWAVCIIQDMYANDRSRAHVNGQYRSDFEIGVHQGLVLGPFLLILELKALSHKLYWYNMEIVLC